MDDFTTHVFSRATPSPSSQAVETFHERVHEYDSRLSNKEDAQHRTLEQLARAIIGGGDAESFSRVEWIRLCAGRRPWPFAEDTARALCTSIWNHAATNPRVARLLLWHAALYLAGHKRALQETLWHAFENGSIANLGAETEDTAVLLWALIQRKFQMVAQSAHNNKVTPNTLFRVYGLPARPNLLYDVYRHVSTVFLAQTNLTEVDTHWYIDCLNESSPELKVKAAERVLRHLQNIDGSGRVYRPLREWLRVNFNPSLDNNLWGLLSGDAKKILREWLGAATYKDFETIVDLVLNHVRMEDWQSNQLRKRRDFWKNYSDNYLRLRILLPDESRRLIKDQLHDELGSEKDIGQLEQDGSEATEVCIFDFGTWYVVEFFRGSASEMRLFEATESLEHFFFGNQISISVRRLRALPNPEVFDHKYLWQPMCQQWLQDHGIYANEGLRRFLMSRENNWWQSYSRSQGLSYKQEDLKDRKQGVARWREKVQRLERKARRWVQHADLSDVEADLYAL